MNNIHRQTFIAFLLLLLAISSILLMLVPKASPHKAKSNKIQVTTTLFVVYDFTRKVGGSKADVVSIMPPGMEPHHFEPKPGELKKIIQSDIFFYISDDMEPWVSRIKNQKTNTIFVNLSKDIKQRSTDKEESKEHNDPHYWLDIGNAQVMTDEIARAFASIDPKNSDYFKRNAASLKSDLNKVDNDFAMSLKTCKTRNIYHAGHFAFGYLAERYGLTYQAIQGYSPESDTKAQDVAAFINQINLQKIKTIYFEELIDPKAAKIIANETGANMLVLNAAHTVSKRESKIGLSYSDIMISNLENLRIGLECK